MGLTHHKGFKNMHPMRRNRFTSSSKTKYDQDMMHQCNHYVLPRRTPCTKHESVFYFFSEIGIKMFSLVIRYATDIIAAGTKQDHHQGEKMHCIWHCKELYEKTIFSPYYTVNFTKNIIKLIFFYHTNILPYQSIQK